MVARTTLWSHPPMIRRILACSLVTLLGCKDDEPPASNDTSDDPTSTSAADDTTATSEADAAGTGDPDPDSGSDGGMPSPCAESPEAMADCVDPAAYQSDLEFIAELRNPGSPHWQAVQDLCAERLTELGYEVTLFEYATGVNVLGTLPGTDPEAPMVLVGAHYDHIPGCTGADDNATGVAASLEAARVFAEGQFQHSITIACWDEEEDGLIGSEAFALAAADQGIPIEVYFNFEMIGYASDEPNSQSIPAGFDLVFPDQIAVVEANEYRGDFLLVAADELAAEPQEFLLEHAERVGLPTIAVTLTAAQKNNDLFGDLRRSDHAPFWATDVGALFLTDSGEFRNERYHCLGGEDTVDSLVPSFSEGVIRATVGAAAQTAVLVE